jgi:hypothetical protein
MFWVGLCFKLLSLHLHWRPFHSDIVSAVGLGDVDMFRTGQFYGPNLPVRRRLRRYRQNVGAEKAERCTKHAYNARKLVAGGLPSITPLLHFL